MQISKYIYFISSFPGFLASWFPLPSFVPPVALVKDGPSHLRRTASVRLPLEFLCRRQGIAHPLPVFFPVPHRAAFGATFFPEYITVTPCVSLRCSGGPVGPCLSQTNRALCHGELGGPRRHPSGCGLLLKEPSLYSRPLYVRV